ncbi:hypothetical protein GOP47_0025641 [Adiantum capillus-veneris]|uniref:Cytochrome P450 n=1 Tax=Adiantum capillus-veneris TaxID=13818 RepID=A0A9D4U1A8_ADICA|nr:hypothetical protein GOP47_0025641 [Adiantum capillus-veneris]
MANSTSIGSLFLPPEAIDYHGALLLGALTLLLSLLFQLWRSTSRKQLLLPLPPGSLGLPFIGETLHFLNTQRCNTSWKFIDDRVSTYGEVFKTHLIGDPTICASNPSGNKMIFTGENKLCHVSWPGSVVTVIGKRSLIALNGDAAKRIRSAMMTFLRPEALQAYTGKTDRSVRGFLEEHWQGKSEVKVFPLMKRFAFGIACELLMSRYEKEEQEMLEEPFTTMMKGILQLPIKLPGTRFSKAIVAANMLRARFQLWINERRQNLALGKGSEDDDMLSCLLTYVDENGLPLSDDDVKDNILLLLFAGHDTSAVVTTMVCRFLALNPDMFDAVYRENKEILEEKGLNEPLSWAHIQKLKLSWRVVQETLRMQPPVQGAFRVAIKEFDFGGFRIPKAWKLYWSTNSTHRNAKYFKEPEKFDPSRFEGVGPVPYTFVPFGGGSRMCPGNEFARMEALVLLHHLVIRFSWTLVDPNELITVDPMPCPMKGLPINLVPRNS